MGLSVGISQPGSDRRSRSLAETEREREREGKGERRRRGREGVQGQSGGKASALCLEYPSYENHTDRPV